MKKFLSLFIALAMVCSLFAGVGAKSAKAATGVISSTVTPATQTVIAGETVGITSTTVYADMSAYSGSHIDGLVTLSKAFSSNVTISLTYGVGSLTVIGTYVLPAGSTTFWLSNFFGDYTHASTHVASGNTNAIDVFNFSFTAPANSGTVTVTAKTVVAPTVYGGIGFEVDALRTVISTATASVTIAPNVLTVANMVDPTLLYNGLSGYIYVDVTDPNGDPVTGLVAANFVFAPVAFTPTVTELVAGSGLYQIALTPNAVGTTNLTVTYPATGATAMISYNVATPSNVWNPEISFTLTGPALAIGGTATFTGIYQNVLGLHSSKTVVTGPALKTIAVAKTICSGGQFVVTLNADLWDTASALTATPTYVQQVFKISPAVTGDVVTVAPTTLNVGDTKDVAVTITQPSGIERNNGKVVLDAGTASGMFTVPTGASYKTVGNTVVMDASQTGTMGNLNIVGGKYVFAGLTFNHAGTIYVYTYGTDGLTLTSISTITVGPRVHTLTATDYTKFVAGVAYPVVKVTGGITGLTFSGLYVDAATIAPVSIIDNGDGSYILNLPAIKDQTSVTYTGLYTASYPDDKWVLTMPIVQPTLTITSVHADGLITQGLTETVKFTLTNPVTGTALAVDSSVLRVQYTTWAVTGIDDLAVSSLWNGTAYALTDHFPVSAKANVGNDNLDTAVDKPYLSIVPTVGGEPITYANALLVSPANITVAPKDLVLYYNQSNMFSVNALDAHKAPIAGVIVSGANTYLQTVPTTQFGGVTGADGTVAFQYIPNYIGQISIAAAGLGIDPYVVQIVPAPADTTAPVIAITKGIDGSSVTSDTLTLTGKVTDNVGVSMVYVGINKVELLPDGSFQTTVKLAAGDNAIAVTAYDAAGNKGTATAKVTYTAAAAKTVIVLTIGTDVVTVNGKATSVDAAPEIINGRTFVPLRFIAETFGATVEWLPETQGITITLGDSTIGLQIGNATAVIDGNIVSLSAAPYIKNGRTMVPLRVISESFGGDVAWDPALRTITITY